MASSIKFKDTKYLDSTSIVHSKTLLSKILSKSTYELVAGTDYSTAYINSSYSSITVTKYANIITLQGVILFKQVPPTWTDGIIKLPTDYVFNAMGYIIEEASGKAIPIKIENGGNVRFTASLSNSNIYCYLSITSIK